MRVGLASHAVRTLVRARSFPNGLHFSASRSSLPALLQGVDILQGLVSQVVFELVLCDFATDGFRRRG
eukprot:2587924-Alexandrium_andersonii.AAC.1